MARKGICSADSMARLTSSMASMRRDFSGSMRLRVGATWRLHCGVGVERLVERGGDVVRAEPGGDVADDGAVGVVEVVADGEDFDGLGAALVHGVEQAGVQALLEKDVSGDSGLHQLLSYSSCDVGGMWRERFGAASIG